MSVFNYLSQRITFCPFGLLSCFFTIAVSFSGCQDREYPQNEEDIPQWHVNSLQISRAFERDISRMDAFIYNDDDLGRLDSFQRFEKEEEGIYEVSSMSGSKTAVILCNGKADSYLWQDIFSLSALGKMRFRLEDEDISRPVMYCSFKTEAGAERSIEPEPIMSGICLRSICCDFSSEAYAGEKLRDVKAYLINVNAEWILSDDSGSNPRRIINTGELWEEDIAGFSSPEMVFIELAEYLDSKVIYPQHTFYCYPNTAEQESIGSPFTRLMIEGSIGSDRYWYPIDIDRGSGGKGVERNYCYIYDIRIRRAGLTSPYGRLEDQTVELETEVMEWKGKTPCDIVF